MRNAACVYAEEMQHGLMIDVCALQDSYLWVAPLAYAIKTVLTSFVVAAVLRPFRAQHRRALFAESQRATGLGSSIKHMLLDRWGHVCGGRATTQEVVVFAKKTNDAQSSWWLDGYAASVHLFTSLHRHVNTEQDNTRPGDPQ